jgi:hypothetical protein
LTVTISVVVLLGGAVYVMCKYAGLRIWQAAVCIIFGFYLASSSLAPEINQFMSSLIRAL